MFLYNDVFCIRYGCMPNVQTVFNTESMLGKFKVTPFIHATGSQLGYSLGFQILQQHSPLV